MKVDFVFVRSTLVLLQSLNSSLIVNANQTARTSLFPAPDGVYSAPCLRFILKPEREKSLLRRHPWVFSGAVERLTGRPRARAKRWMCAICAAQVAGARRLFPVVANPRPGRGTFDPDEPVDAAFFRRRIQAAIERRALFGLSLAGGGAVPPRRSLAFPDGSRPELVPANAFRLVHAESDGLPGLVADWYDGVIVAQFLTAGSEFWRDTLADLLMELTGASAVYERSDADVRELEGSPPRTGLLRGTLSAPVVVVQEYGLRFRVNLETGHKTGFYLDQRANRRRVGELARWGGSAC